MAGCGTVMLANAQAAAMQMPFNATLLRDKYLQDCAFSSVPASPAVGSGEPFNINPIGEILFPASVGRGALSQGYRRSAMIVLRLLAVSLLMFSSFPAASQRVHEEPDWAGAETVTVQLSNFKFDPSTINLKAGKAYDLRLQNLASGGHDFSAKAFFADARIKDADRDKIVAGKVSLRGGQSIDLHLVPAHAGTYNVHCTHFMHGAFGMTGEIVVQ
jgi:uncharacterized cupredoxin-like copper-binding protein